MNDLKLIASLLASEDIRIIETKMNTAYFDLEKRELALPAWKDINEFVRAMLICHEVGHALFTPKEGWHHSTEELGVNRMYLNVIEDPRQERLFQIKYPGAIRIFRKAYEYLTEINFLEIDMNKIDGMYLIDRLNIHFKSVGIDVPFFNSTERGLLSRASTIKTFDEAVQLAIDVKAYDEKLKEKKDKKKEMQDLLDQLQNEEGDASEEQGDDQQETAGEETEEGDSQDQYQDQPSDENGDDSEEENKTSGSGSDGEFEELDDEELPDVDDDVEAGETDETYRKNEAGMETEDHFAIMNNIVPGKNGSTAIEYKTILEDVADFKKRCEAGDYPTAIQKYEDFSNKSRKSVNMLVRNFEMRRAAWENARATLGKGGKINPVALSNYKFSEEIFMDYMMMPEGQSHGMIFLLDLSGSMSSIIQKISEQLIIMTTFCRKLGIPFEVYTYTSDMTIDKGVLSNVKLTNILSSKMNKTEFKDMCFALYNINLLIMYLRYDGNENLSFGSTPTAEALIAMDFYVDQFIKRTKVQKTHMMVLTDGAPNGCQLAGYSYNGYNRTIKLNLIKGSLTVPAVDGNSGKTIKALIEYYNGVLNGSTILYNVLDSASYSAVRQISAMNIGAYNLEERKSLVSKSKKESMVVRTEGTFDYSIYMPEKIFKYNRYEVDASTHMNDIDGDSKLSEVKKSFMNFNKAKNFNKTFAENFSKIIA